MNESSLSAWFIVCMPFLFARFIIKNSRFHHCWMQVLLTREKNQVAILISCKETTASHKSEQKQEGWHCFSSFGVLLFSVSHCIPDYITVNRLVIKPDQQYFSSWVPQNCQSRKDKHIKRHVNVNKKGKGHEDVTFYHWGFTFPFSGSTAGTLLWRRVHLVNKEVVGAREHLTVWRKSLKRISRRAGLRQAWQLCFVYSCETMTREWLQALKTLSFFTFHSLLLSFTWG